MGKSSKPLCIIIDETLYQADIEYWTTLRKQGFEIIRDDTREIVDIYLAPRAMRMTADMMKAMPSAVSLAIKGARELRYAPHGTGAVKGKPKGAKDKKPRKGKNSAIKVEAGDGGTSGDAQVHSATTGKGEGVREATNSTASESSNTGGDTRSTI